MPLQNHSRRLADPRIRSAWLPILSGALLCLFVVVLWQTLARRERENRRQAVQAEAANLANLVIADLYNRIPTLRRMAMRWANRGGVPKAEFISDATAYIEDSHGVQAIEWADKNGIVRWTAPVKGNELAQDLDLSFEPRRRAALEQSKTTRKPAATAPIDLLEGCKGFVLYYPIYMKDDFDGFILGVFRIREWLEHSFAVGEKGPAGRFGVAVSYDGVPVYKNDDWELLRHTDLDATAAVPFMGHELLIRIRPTPAYLEQAGTHLPELAAGFGLLLSVLLGWIVGLLQKARATEVALGERVKEQTCIYSIAEAAAGGDNLESFFQKAADLLPPGWLHPGEAYARIVASGREFRTENFHETPWKMSATIEAEGGAVRPRGSRLPP